MIEAWQTLICDLPAGGSCNWATDGSIKVDKARPLGLRAARLRPSCHAA